MLQTDRRTLSKIDGEDKTLQTDKQTDKQTDAATLRKLVVGIKRYKQTEAPYQKKLVVRIKHYKQTNREMKPFKNCW